MSQENRPLEPTQIELNVASSTETTPADEPSAEAIARHSAPWWIKVFVAFHIFAITTWALPWPPVEVIKHKRTPVGTDWLLLANAEHLKPFPPSHAYLWVTGFWQYWDMFAPEPSDTDFYGTATITYRDGHAETYQYPRMLLLSIPEKFLKERYRKFYERAYDTSKPFIWSRFGQRVALLNDKYPGNPPVQVDLIKHWRHIAAPGMPQPREYESDRYFQYVVDQAQLAKDKSGVQ